MNEQTSYLAVFKKYTNVIGNSEGKQIAKTNGGEWKAACPKCGGDDRLCIWPNRHILEPTRPAFWCRGCNWSGAISNFIAFCENKHRSPERHINLRTRQGREIVQNIIQETIS